MIWSCLSQFLPPHHSPLSEDIFNIINGIILKRKMVILSDKQLKTLQQNIGNICHVYNMRIIDKNFGIKSCLFSFDYSAEELE